MHKTTRAALIAASAFTLFSAAHAEGLYIGGQLGSPDYHSNIAGTDGNGRGVSGKAYLGWQFNPYVGVEGGYFDLGHADGNAGRVKINGGYVDAVGTLPLRSDFSLLGSAGFAQGRFKTAASGNDNSPAIKLGVGAQYDFTKTLALRAQYDRYHFTDAFDNKANVGQTTVGLKLSF